MNKPVRTIVSLSLFVAFSASLAQAGPQEDWLEGARMFDGAALGGVTKTRPMAAMHGLQTVYVGDPVRQTIQRKAGQDSFETELETQVYRVVTTLEPILETYEDVVCNETGGEGRGDWNGLFSAPKREKAARLAQSVKGVGEATAQCIIDSGAFSSKPRSWSAFKSRMKQADESCGKGVYYRTVVQFGRENAAALGYYSEQDCRTVQVQELVIRPVEHRIPDRIARTTVRINVRMAPLRPSEMEELLVEFDGMNVTVSPNSRFNRYQVSQNGDDFVLNGQRQRVTPTNTLTLEILARGMGKVLQMTDRDFSPAIGIDSANAQTVAKLRIRQKGNWKRAFIDKTLAELSVPLYGGSSMTDLEQVLGNSVPKGEQYYIEYSLTRMNSLLNNESVSSSKDSAEFTR